MLQPPHPPTPPTPPHPPTLPHPPTPPHPPPYIPASTISASASSHCRKISNITIGAADATLRLFLTPKVGISVTMSANSMIRGSTPVEWYIGIYEGNIGIFGARKKKKH